MGVICHGFLLVCGGGGTRCCLHFREKLSLAVLLMDDAVGSRVGQVGSRAGDLAKNLTRIHSPWRLEGHASRKERCVDRSIASGGKGWALS
jgi:hypothetical protein